jgi:hypothetical protein
VNGNTEQVSSGFYGVVVEAWLNEQVFVSGGAGFAIAASNFLLSDSAVEPLTGYGFAARAGYSFLTTKNHSLRAAVEVFPAFYEDVSMFGTALNFEWQYF